VGTPNLNLRKLFYADTCTNHNGKPFHIVGMRMEDVGGDNLEPIYTVSFHDGTIENYVNSECIFEGFDTNFDEWVKKTYS